MKFKLGRKPRKFDKKVPHMDMLLNGMALPAVPATCDWTKGIKQWGMMLNDNLGDCTCAAVYHARQIWTANTMKESTEPDVDVLKLYENACGYNPNDPNSDQGGVEQDVLNYLLNTGMPLSDGTTDKILGFAEVNHTSLTDVKMTINEFGVAYIGIEVPDSIYDSSGNPIQTWNYVPGSQEDDGHAIVLAGYNAVGFQFISWGSIYTMTYKFFQHYCDEVYAVVDKNWVAKAGKSPLGLTAAQLEVLMKQVA